MMRTQLQAGAAVLLFTVAGASAPANGVGPDGTAGPGWDAWFGCWQEIGSEAADGRLVCILPGADRQSVRIANIEAGAIVDETVLHADGVARPVEDGGCTGAETVSFSRDERRVYTRAELDCRGVQRVSTAVLALISETEWLDAQAFTVAGQSAGRTVRYRAVPRSAVPQAVAALLPPEQRLALESARLDASAPLDIEDVAEAAALIEAPALEALLAARQHGFGLSARGIAYLAQHGVAGSTIDVMVALSYPSHFAVRQPEAMGGVGYGTAAEGGDVAWNECRDPYLTDRRYRASCYGVGFGSIYDYDRYGYSRYGYSRWGHDRYGWNYGGGPIIIVQPHPDGSPAPRGGSVVKGRGFTGGNSPVTRRAQPRSSDQSQASTRSSGGAGTSAAAGTRSGTSAGTAEPKPESGSSTGRKAKPRPPGGGEGGGL